MDQRAPFSNYGPEVSIAPGVDVLSLYHAIPYLLYSMSGFEHGDAPRQRAPRPPAQPSPDLPPDDLVALMTATAVDANAASHPAETTISAGASTCMPPCSPASTGLTLKAKPAAFDPVATGDPLVLDIQVTASKLPVEGAVVYLQTLHAADLTTAAVTQRSITNAGGNVSFAFTAPDQPGDYILRVQVGSALVDLPLKVAKPFDIGITIHKPELMVGGESTPFTVTVRSKEGDLLAEPLAMHLETSLGHINGQRSLETVVVGGIFTGTLRSGNIAGTATVMGRLTYQRASLRQSSCPARR